AFFVRDLQTYLQCDEAFAQFAEVEGLGRCPGDARARAHGDCWVAVQAGRPLEHERRVVLGVGGRADQGEVSGQGYLCSVLGARDADEGWEVRRRVHHVDDDCVRTGRPLRVGSGQADDATAVVVEGYLHLAATQGEGVAWEVARPREVF